MISTVSRQGIFPEKLANCKLLFYIAEVNQPSDFSLQSFFFTLEPFSENSLGSSDRRRYFKIRKFFKEKSIKKYINL